MGRVWAATGVGEVKIQDNADYKRRDEALKNRMKHSVIIIRGRWERPGSLVV